MRETSVIRAYSVIRLLVAATVLAVLLLSGTGVQAASTPGIIIVTIRDKNA